MDIKELRKKQKAFYDSIVSVYCPILKETVYFTSDGFNHLIFESNRQRRIVGEQYMKLMCLDHAPVVVSNSQKSTKRITRKKVNGKWKNVEQFKLVFEVEAGKKIRVVIEKRGSGKCIFWSIMPHDKASKPPKTKKHPVKGAI